MTTGSKTGVHQLAPVGMPSPVIAMSGGRVRQVTLQNKRAPKPYASFTGRAGKPSLADIDVHAGQTTMHTKNAPKSEASFQVALVSHPLSLMNVLVRTLKTKGVPKPDPSFRSHSQATNCFRSRTRQSGNLENLRLTTSGAYFNLH